MIKICAFDIWMRNIDRSANNPNLILQETGGIIKLFAIDHSSIFSELDFNNLTKEIDEPPAIGENLVDKELLSKIYFNYGLFFDKIKNDICEKIAKVTEDQIKK